MTTIAAPSATRAADRRPAVALVTLLALATLALQMANPGVTDVSWLIVVAERVLDGQRLYVDLIEVNPPASLLIYLPSVWLARLVGLPAEGVINAVMAAGTALSVLAAGRIVDRASLLVRPAVLAAAAMAVFSLSVGSCFAQREHVALVLLLPALAVAALRSVGGIPPLAIVLGAGLAAGFAVSIKPHFLAALVLPQLAVAVSRRSARPLAAPELLVAGAVLAVYVAVTIVAFPAFWSDIYPMVSDVYRPVRRDLATLAILAGLPAAAAVLFFLAARPRPFGPLVLIPLLSAAGFLLAFAEQGKGWPYHLQPALALTAFAMLAACTGETAPPRPPAVRALGDAMLAIVVAGILFLQWPRPPVTASLEPAIPSHLERPTVMALSDDLKFAHPFTRRIGGRFVGRLASQWISNGSLYLLATDRPPDRRDAIEGWLAFDRRMAFEDIVRAEPDVLVLDLRFPLDDRGRLRLPDGRDLPVAGLAALLEGYREIARNERAALLLRRDLLPQVLSTR